MGRSRAEWNALARENGWPSLKALLTEYRDKGLRAPVVASLLGVDRTRIVQLMVELGIKRHRRGGPWHRGRQKRKLDALPRSVFTNLTAQQIAERFDVHIHTARSYLRDVLGKLQRGRRTD